MWLDQCHLVELLAKSIPFDWKVLVKEHPGTLVARVRPLSFYRRLKKIPNVCIASIDADMHQLISNAEMVAVITGTAGWEAILRGKPVITFTDNMWDVLSLSRKCTNIEALSRDIYDEICRIKQISHAERKRRIVYLLASMLQHSFNVSFPNQFVYTEAGTDEEYKVVGIETANALKKHIEYLQEEKGYKFY
jgi:capsule polysaccharide export protein KpsC/LpsZ